MSEEFGKRGSSVASLQPRKHSIKVGKSREARELPTQSVTTLPRAGRENSLRSRQRATVRQADRWDGMIRDMHLARLAEGTRREYLRAVRQLAAHYMVSPDYLSERNIDDCLLDVHDELGVAKGTFAPIFAGLKFFCLLQKKLDRQPSLGTLLMGTDDPGRIEGSRFPGLRRSRSAVPGRPRAENPGLRHDAIRDSNEGLLKRDPRVLPRGTEIPCRPFTQRYAVGLERRRAVESVCLPPERARRDRRPGFRCASGTTWSDGPACLPGRALQPARG